MQYIAVERLGYFFVLVCRQVFAYFEDVFNVFTHSDSNGDFLNGERLAGLLGKKIEYLALRLNYFAGCLLASLDARLVKGIDVD